MKRLDLIAQEARGEDIACPVEGRRVGVLYQGTGYGAIKEIEKVADLICEDPCSLCGARAKDGIGLEAVEHAPHRLKLAEVRGDTIIDLT